MEGFVFTDGTFDAVTVLIDPPTAENDFNADGKSDILWQNNDGTPAIWLLDGTNLISGANVGFNPNGAGNTGGHGGV